MCDTNNNTLCMQILLYMNIVTLDEDWTFQCGVKWNVQDAWEDNVNECQKEVYPSLHCYDRGYGIAGVECRDSEWY